MENFDIKYHLGQNGQDIMEVKPASQLLAEKIDGELFDKVSELLREKGKGNFSPTVVPTIKYGATWSDEDKEKLRKGFGGIYPMFPNMLDKYGQEAQDKVKQILNDTPDVPDSPIFVLPLWLGRDASSSIMGVLNYVYKYHGDLPVNGMFVIQDEIGKWLNGLVAADIANVYVTLYGVKVLPPRGVACNEEGDWDVQCKILGIEFLSFEAEETHGTPLRISVSVNSNDAYTICKELHERGKFYITGECEVEQNDIVAFKVKELCYTEDIDGYDKDEPQILLGGANSDDNDMPF